MLRLVARRLLTMVPTLFGIVLVALLLVELMPGDPAEIMAGEDATPEAVERIRQQMNLDQPLPQRLASYLWDLAHFDLGRSPGSNIPVWDRISETLPVTLSLALVTLTITVVVGVAA